MPRQTVALKRIRAIYISDYSLQDDKKILFALNYCSCGILPTQNN